MITSTRRVTVTLPETNPLTPAEIRAIIADMARESIIIIELEDPKATLQAVLDKLEQESLMELMDVKRNTLWRWRKGDTMSGPHQKMLWQLAVKLDIPAPCSRRKIRLRRK